MQQSWRDRFPRHRFNFIVSALANAGVTPNTVSWAGFVVAAASGVLAAYGLLVAAGAVSLLGGIMDMFDGALARMTGTSSKFGALLDSTLDRYNEAVLLGGVCVWASSTGDTLLVLLCVLALSGSLLVSYIRARAEGLGMECKEGMFTRPERVVVMGVGLLFGLHVAAVGLIAVLANITALQRLAYLYKQAQD